MIKAGLQIHWLFCAILIGGAIHLTTAAAAHGQVAANPERISFEATDQSVSVELTRNGEPVPASAIKGFNIFVGEHDYREMLDMTKANGKVTFTPTEYVEIGSYHMIIYTTEGDASLSVYTPLSTMPNTIEKQAAALGVSIERMREILGMEGKSGPGVMTIDMPDVHFLGQELSITVPEAPNTTFVWGMNGETIAEGPGANVFEYVFSKPGAHVLTHKQIKDGETVLAASDTTNVVHEPSIAMSVQAGREMMLRAPAGYASYNWQLDGERIGDGEVLRFVFDSPGTYTVQCRAMTPVSGNSDTFRVLNYEVTARSN